MRSLLPLLRSPNFLRIAQPPRKPIEIKVSRPQHVRVGAETGTRRRTSYWVERAIDTVYPFRPATTNSTSIRQRESSVSSRVALRRTAATIWPSASTRASISHTPTSLVAGNRRHRTRRWVRSLRRLVPDYIVDATSPTRSRPRKFQKTGKDTATVPLGKSRYGATLATHAFGDDGNVLHIQPPLSLTGHSRSPKTSRLPTTPQIKERA